MRRASLALSLLAAMLTRCGEESTAIQLVLTPDPSLSPLQPMLQALEHLSVVVDGESGLSGVSQAGPLPGGGTAVDWDGDKTLEARFDGVQVPDDALPVLEVGLEQNTDRELDFRVLGFGPGVAQGAGQERSVAEGGASARVSAGQVRRVGAPFNLTSRARPPKVVLVVPSEGATVLVPLVSVIAVLSTTVKTATVAGHVRLVDPKGKAVSLSAVKVETMVVVTGAVSREERSLVTLEFPGLSERGTYEVRIGPGIESSTGKRFDQNPATATEEGFVGRFTWEISAGGGKPCDSCPAGYLCHPTLPGCIPEVSCAAGCGTGQVCDPTQKQCVADCRTIGLCFDTKKTCDPKTGLCR